MEDAVGDGKRFHNDLPDARRRRVEAKEDQFGAAFFNDKPVVYGNLRALKKEVKFRACTDPKRNARSVFPGGRDDGDGENIRNFGPEFHGEAGDIFSNAQFDGTSI